MKKINFNFLILLSLLMAGCTATYINTIISDPKLIGKFIRKLEQENIINPQ